MAVGAKPPAVIRAVTLLWGSLLIGLLNALSGPGASLLQLPPVVLVIAAVMLALVALLVVKISAGRNWARIVLLVIVALGAPLSLIGLDAAFAESVLGGLLGLAVTALQIYAVVLLFTAPGKTWFAKAPV
jgi:hypothetical protein